MKTFTAYVEWDPDTQLYVGVVPGVPAAHTQGATLDELQQNLKEVLALCLEEYQGSLEDLPRFVGIRQIEVPARAGFPSWILRLWRKCFYDWGFSRSDIEENTSFTGIPMAGPPRYPIILDETSPAPCFGRSSERLSRPPRHFKTR